MKLSSVLVANRGEIALRVIKTARAMGMQTVAVFSEADRDALYVRAADRSVYLGPAESSESYLNIGRVIQAAKSSGAEAIHPGYGFLAENAEFADACAEAGLVFVGPPADAIRLMGSKRAAKQRMIEAGVPCVPGYEGSDDTPALVAAATDVGFPLLIKASAGGGGRGIRRVDRAEDLADNIARAQSEALSSFGDASVILERLVDPARHIEVQVFCDQHGHAVHLAERDCSVQRRHQKVIEEAPAPHVSAQLRQRLGEAAVKAAQAIGYQGAGTCEFLLDADDEFFFLEMNTRLQVEHPVTEAITGFDLVQWQFDVAAGKELPIRQDELRTNGHAVEARIYAEQPETGFTPSTGSVIRCELPTDCRVDAGVESGARVSAFYDAMVAKIICHGRDRPEALGRLTVALKQLVLHGVRHNGAFLLELLQSEVVAAGNTSTSFVDRNLDALTERTPDAAVDALAAVLVVGGAEGAPWFRSSGLARSTIRLDLGEGPQLLRVSREDGGFRVSGEDLAVSLRLDVDGPGRGRFEVAGLGRQATWTEDTQDGGRRLWLTVEGRTVVAQPVSASSKSAAQTSDELRAPMAAKVVAVNTCAQTNVSAGDILVVVEAMKMQLELTAPRDGVVDTLTVVEGDQVAAKQLLLSLAPLDEPS